MRLINFPLWTALLMLTTMLACGCAGEQGVFSWGGSASSSAKADSPAPSRRTNANVSVGQPTFVGSGHEQDNVRPALIGMYGEQINHVSHEPNASAGRANFTQISFVNEGACFDPAVDPRGRRIAFASTMHQSTANLYIKSVQGSTVTQITSDPADDVMPAFSPDGSRLAFASNRSGKWDIYVVSINGGPPIQLTDDQDHELHPSWSPDGRLISYCRFNSQSGRWEIWTVDVENPGMRKFLDYGMFPQWSPNETNPKILFQRPRQRGSRFHGVWTVDYVDGEATRPTEIVSAANAATINPTWSPDGKHIAFVTVMNPDQSTDERPTRSDLWIVSLDGSTRVKLTDSQFANFQPVWGSDDRVYFISDRSGIDNIWSLSTGAVNELGRPVDSTFVGVDTGVDQPGGD